MFAHFPFDIDLIAIVEDTVAAIINQVVAKAIPLPLLISSSSSSVISSIDSLVEEALSDMSGEFHDLQSHLDHFLYIIRQHVITPGSPSSSSDISDWNDLSRWPDMRSRNEHSRRCIKKPLDTDGDYVGCESKLSSERGGEKNNPLEYDSAACEGLIRRSASTHLTVEVFRRAFETGNFSEVEAIMSSYSIESQFSRDVNMKVEQSIHARPRNDAIKLLLKQETLSVPLPSMMVARHLNHYVPDELPSMTTSMQVPRRCSIDSLIVESRRELGRPTQSENHKKLPLIELQVIKHGRHGKPKFKRLSVDTSLGVISWGTGSILMVDIKQIRCGRQTYILNRKHVAQAYEGLFASIVTPTRTLDLEMRSRTERNEAVAQIQQLVAEYLKIEKNQHVTWNRHGIDNSDLDHQIMVSHVATYRSSRISSWKSALLKYLFRRRPVNSWTADHL